MLDWTARPARAAQWTGRCATTCRSGSPRRASAGTYKQRARDDDAPGRPRRGRRARAAQPLRQQLPRPRRPSGGPRGRARGARPLGLRAWPRCASSAAPRSCTAQLEERLSRLPRHRGHDPLSAPASTPTAGSSRRCSDERGRGHLRRSSTTPRSSTASACARRAGCATQTATWTSSRRGCARRRDARYRLIATDGVFSMDGYLARLDRDLRPRRAPRRARDGRRLARGRLRRAERPRHATSTTASSDARRHPHRHARQGARRRERRLRRGQREIVELLRQRSRPYLFSNSLAPPVAAASLRALELIEGSSELRDRLRANTARFRAGMSALGFELLPGEHPIVPVMIGEERQAARLSADARRARASTRSASPTPSCRAARRASARRCRRRTTRADLDFAARALRRGARGAWRLDAPCARLAQRGR